MARSSIMHASQSSMQSNYSLQDPFAFSAPQGQRYDGRQVPASQSQQSLDTWEMDKKRLDNEQKAPATEHYIYHNAPQAYEFTLRMKQQPERAIAHGELARRPTIAEADMLMEQAAANGDKKAARKTAKWSIEPLPVVELTSVDGNPHKIMNINPNLWIYVRLKSAPSNTCQDIDDDCLIGTRCNSVSKVYNHVPDACWTPFGDLHVRDPGEYYLVFDLFELVLDLPSHESHTIHRCSVQSDIFVVHPKGYRLPPPTQVTKVNYVLLAHGMKLRFRRQVQPRKPKNESWDSTVQQEAVTTRGSLGYQTFHKRGRMSVAGPQGVMPYYTNVPASVQHGMIPQTGMYDIASNMPMSADYIPVAYGVADYQRYNQVHPGDYVPTSTIELEPPRLFAQTLNHPQIEQGVLQTAGQGTSPTFGMDFPQYHATQMIHLPLPSQHGLQALTGSLAEDQYGAIASMAAMHAPQALDTQPAPNTQRAWDEQRYPQYQAYWNPHNDQVDPDLH